MVRIEIASDHNAFNAGHCTSDHLTDVREELRNSDLTFVNILCSLGLSIPVSNQIALLDDTPDPSFIGSLSEWRKRPNQAMLRTAGQRK